MDTNLFEAHITTGSFFFCPFPSGAGLISHSLILGLSLFCTLSHRTHLSTSLNIRICCYGCHQPEVQRRIGCCVRSMFLLSPASRAHHPNLVLHAVYRPPSPRSHLSQIPLPSCPIHPSSGLNSHQYLFLQPFNRLPNAKLLSRIKTTN
jgi:hypothetical protein